MTQNLHLLGGPKDGETRAAESLPPAVYLEAPTRIAVLSDERVAERPLTGRYQFAYVERGIGYYRWMGWE